MALKNPILSNPIAVDIPKLNEILDALSKANPTDVDGISTGAMRLYEVSSGKWQWQEYNGSTWAPIPFLQHSVDQLDGYHAAITPAANTVAVRNASGVLEDSIAGNAATASSAATLSQTLPVNKGGTGATTSAAARANLGAPPTSHASTNTTHGVGNATQYGHLKLSDATNSSSGVSGGVAATPAAVKFAKDAADAAQKDADDAMAKASETATASKAGIAYFPAPFIAGSGGKIGIRTASVSQIGIVQLNNTVTSTSTVQAATANAVKTVYDKAVEAEAAVAKALPVGSLIASFATSMTGYLLCNGAAVSRATYADLFALLDTSFGTGNGSTTFNLPDFRGKTLWGANNNLRDVIAAGLPNITGNVFPKTYAGATDGTPIGGDGAFKTVTNRSNIAVGKADYIGKGYYPYANFDASRSSAIYGKSTTVQPPAIAVNIFIKY